MKRGANKVILVGNIGKDPETRFFTDGGAVTNMSLATSEAWKDKQTGEQKEKTEWHRLVFKDRGNYRLGQIAGEYIKKGSKIYIEGKLQTRKWQDQSGNDRYSTEVVVEEFQFLGGNEQASNRSNEATQSPEPAQSPSSGGDFTDFEDDIPFN